jgi:hypothetical protein
MGLNVPYGRRMSAPKKEKDERHQPGMAGEFRVKFRSVWELNPGLPRDRRVY